MFFSRRLVETFKGLSRILYKRFSVSVVIMLACSQEKLEFSWQNSDLFYCKKMFISEKTKSSLRFFTAEEMRNRRDEEPLKFLRKKIKNLIGFVDHSREQLRELLSWFSVQNSPGWTPTCLRNNLRALLWECNCLFHGNFL